MPEGRLDSWLASPAVRIHHEREARADANALWAAAGRVRLRDTRTLGRLVRWRIPGLDPRLTYHDLLRGYPFVVLEEDERMLISGLAGRIWTLARDYPRLERPEDFAAWDTRATVRVLLGHWVCETGDGLAELVSETWIEPVDRVAELRLRALWSVIGPFQRRIGVEPLTLAARAAEESAG
jgi:hypothetical protein